MVSLLLSELNSPNGKKLSVIKALSRGGKISQKDLIKRQLARNDKAKI
jgi:hypothetical protein